MTREGLPKDIVDDVKKSMEHPDRLPYYQLTPARRPTLAHKFNQLREAGVTVLIGTDSGIPDELPHPFDLARAGCLGDRLQGRSPDGDSRRYLLAGGGDVPVSVGQLSSFRYDGTIESNPLYESRRAALTDLARMLA